MKDQHPPIREIGATHSFCFDCRPGLRCFTHCCHGLELELTPYDMLRLRRATGLSSTELLAKYVIIEQLPDDVLPHCFLTMVDDGTARCAFLGRRGCSVYDHRPGACRSYPVGQATIWTGENFERRFVLVQEDHCHGFAEAPVHTPLSYLASQDVSAYETFNKAFAALTQNQAFKEGFRPDRQQCELFINTLFDLDRFAEQVKNGEIILDDPTPAAMPTDEELLEYGFRWVEHQFFGSGQ